MMALDIETYPNWMLVLIYDDKTGKTYGASAYGEDEPLSRASIDRIRGIVTHNEIATYNGANFDLAILAGMFRGYSCSQINEMSNEIIQKKRPGWMVARQYGVNPVQPLRHIDTMAINPALRISLKSCGARLHSRHIIDLPIKPNTHVTREQADILTYYCLNDCKITIDLCKHMADRIKSRKQMDLEDATAMADAKIAEYYMKKHGAKKPPHGPPHDWFKDEFLPLLPENIIFANKDTQHTWDWIRKTHLKTDRTGKPIVEYHGFGPRDGRLGTMKYNDMEYRIGIGGLHSQEKGVMADAIHSYDVVSYYPRIILNMGFAPKRFDGDFQAVYRTLYERRLAAKARGDKAGSEALKIVINGTFGKFGNAWSTLYDPQLMISVTLAGQMLLAHLIDKCWQDGIDVISVNTDGIITKQDARWIIEEWENEHGLQTECLPLRGYWGRDVNNYCCVDYEGKWKGKGIFAEPSVTKTPHADIAAEAAKAYFIDGTPVEATIARHTDIRGFIIARNAKGGCEWRGEKLGRMARWFWSTEGSPVTYVQSGNKVAGSDGAYPVMSMIDHIPEHLDRQRYADYAWDIVTSIMGEE